MRRTASDMAHGPPLSTSLPSTDTYSSPYPRGPGGHRHGVLVGDRRELRVTRCFSQKNTIGSRHTAPPGWPPSWKGALREPPPDSAEERHHPRPRLPVPCPPPARTAARRAPRPRRSARPAATIPFGAEDAQVRVGDVHRPAQGPCSSRWPGASSSAIIGSGARPLGEAVAVAAVVGRDHVRRGQRPAGADRGRLLADRQVDEAWHLAGAVEVRQPAPRTPRIRVIRPVGLEQAVRRQLR